MDDEQLKEIDRIVTEAAGPTELLTKAVIDDPVLHARLKKVGVLTKEAAKSYGAVGPTARGSGLPIDVPGPACGLVFTSTNAGVFTVVWELTL